MTAMAYLIGHPEIKHGTVRVAFTPDEEIGRGPEKFDVAAFNADFAYTVDGGPLGELEYESFNAAKASITIQGTNVHPGTAKNKMVNSIKIAMELNSMLPPEQAPEHTEGYEGFYHLLSQNGDTERTKMEYIIRDFDRTEFAAKREHLTQVVKQLQAKYGEERVILEMRDQYYNMREKIEPVKEIVDVAYEAMESLGITPIVKPIRGGTDGSQLSYMGLPTPNIFTGGENFHGKFEYISVDNMLKSVQVIIEILKRFEARGRNIERFSGYGDIYDRYRPAAPPLVTSLLTGYLQRKPELVLDLGCGTGLSTLVWKKHADQVIGIEPNDDMRSVAESKLEQMTDAAHIRFMAGYSNQLAISSETADIITCSQSFHWMEPASTLSEAAR
ncbi:hypothetical protein BGX30_007931, partial [Mortierella sp. GBA39]